MRNFAVSLALVQLVGCATVYRQEGVPSSDPSRIAVIEAEPCKNHQCLLVQEIDGKWRGPGWIQRYELVPGKRTLKLVFMAPGVHGKRALLVEFEAQAGRTYVIRENANFAAMQWNPEVVDTGTQEVVSRQVGTAFAY